jgi:molybdopterin converting factor small subunit
MPIKIKLHPYVKSYLKAKELVEVEGKTLGECLDEVDKKYPGFRAKLIEDGHVKKGFKIFLNDKNAFPGEMERETRDGDVVTIITYISGG